MAWPVVYHFETITSGCMKYVEIQKPPNCWKVKNVLPIAGATSFQESQKWESGTNSYGMMKFAYPIGGEVSYDFRTVS
jgi:hypothetical protein